MYSFGVKARAFAGVCVAVMVAAALAGCSTPAPKVAPDTFTYERQPIAVRDAESVFSPLFNYDNRFSKDPFESGAERKRRLNAPETAGMDITFLIPPELCEIDPHPEEKIYIVRPAIAVSSKLYKLGLIFRATAVVAERIETRQRLITASEGGVVVTMPAYVRKQRVLLLEDPRKAFPSLLWRHSEDFAGSSFGMPVRNPAPELRALLKEGKVGLALRGKIGDLSEGFEDPDPSDATQVDSDEISALPFVLEEMYAVDSTTLNTLIGWRRGR